MPKLRVMLLAGLTAAIAVTTTVAFAATRTIKVGDDWFVRSDTSKTPVVTVTPGSKVRWQWTGEDDHNVRLRSAPSSIEKSKFKSTTKSSGTFTRTFKVTGTYRFVCTIHEDEGQKLTLKVKSKT